MRQTVALRAEYYGKPLLALKRLVINTHRVIGKRHCRCFKAQRTQICGAVRLPPMLVLSDISPRDKKYRSHADSYGSPAKRITAGRGYQHSVYAERRRRAYYCSCVADIGYIFEYGNPACISAKLLCPFRRRTLHSAQHSPCQLIACKPGHYLAVGGIYRNITATLYYAVCTVIDILSVCEHRNRLTACVKGYFYNRLTFGYEYSVFVFVHLAQSCICKARVYFKLWDIYVGNVNNFCHIFYRSFRERTSFLVANNLQK